MPEPERVQYSAITGQSLFYLGETCSTWAKPTGDCLAPYRGTGDSVVVFKVRRAKEAGI